MTDSMVQMRHKWYHLIDLYRTEDLRHPQASPKTGQLPEPSMNRFLVRMRHKWYNVIELYRTEDLRHPQASPKTGQLPEPSMDGSYGTDEAQMVQCD
jgi:hypothetical protein